MKKTNFGFLNFKPITNYDDRKIPPLNLKMFEIEEVAILRNFFYGFCGFSNSLTIQCIFVFIYDKYIYNVILLVYGIMNSPCSYKNFAHTHNVHNLTIPPTRVGVPVGSYFLRGM